MNDLKKSFAFVAVSGALAATAVWASIPKTTTVEAFNDQGEAFFPDFTNPDDCMTLDIVENDAETGVPQPFKVTFQNGKWVIPSHGNYPADAADRLSQTAAKVIDLKKDTIRSSRTEDHKVLGVIDPLDNKTGMVDGVGKRITLRDKTDRVLAEYILGKDVPGQPGQKFVRRPQQARTYAVKVEAEPSSRFADWIEPNLLGLQANQIRSATFLNEKVDPSVLKIFKGEILRITRKDAAAPWVLAGLPPTEEVDPAKSTALVNALADLKIVGVRPKPAALTAYFKGETPTASDPMSALSLQSKGFYFQDGQFYSDQGALIVQCDDGLGYILQFGGVTFAKGEALSSGKGEDDAKAAKEKQPGAPKEDGLIESRYLFVRAQFDPESIPKPKAPAAAAVAGSLPSNVFQQDPAEIKAEAERYAKEKAEYDAKIAVGTQKAEELSARFAPWYYVVPGDSYRSLLLDRKTLVHAKPAPGARPPQGDNPFGPGGLPPQLRGLMPQGHP